MPDSSTCILLPLCAIPLMAQPGRIAGRIDDARTVLLSGSVHPRAQARYDRGPVDPSLKIGYITLVLKPAAGQQVMLERLLDEQQDRSSSNYHRWLTPEQFGDRFGLSRSDYATVVSWLESRGFHVEDIARARNWVAFSGSARQIASAFHTEIHRYVVDGESHFANATELRIPAVLDSLVSGVRGLDDFWKTGRSLPAYTTASGAHQLAPDDWATIYDVTPLYGIGIDGTGQRIAIVGRSSITPADMAKFRSTFNLPPGAIEQHLVGPEPGVTNAATEAALDLEWAGAIARNATLVYVYANNFNDAVQAVVDQNLATVMSESFGTCEAASAVGNRAMAQQANAQGITFVASSGDSGPAGCDPHGFFGSTGGTPASLGFAVGIPASFPEVTAVGGTQFNDAGGQYWRSSNGPNGGSALSYIPEVVWNQAGAPGLLASGGGPSIAFPKPAWQSGPGVPEDNARDIPDVSFSASGFPHDPYIIVYNGNQTNSGGTSAGAPAFAGVVALLNQYVVSKGFQTQPGLGYINPQLYRLARTSSNVFHDITQGNNIVSCAPNSPGCSNGSMGYTAGPGYDLATGLGSADVYNLVTQWNTPAAATKTVLAADPGSITLGDPVQLTATVTGAGSGLPGGTVTFSAGRTILGTAALLNVAGVAMATLTVTGPLLHAGNATVIATYDGDSTFNGSTGSVAVRVAPSSSGSLVVVSISPNPAHSGQPVRVSLTEEAGVGTTITGWSINGTDNFFRFATDFGGAALPAYGTLSASFATALSLPTSRVYVFTGVDADGRQWSQQYTLSLVAPIGSLGFQLFSVPSAVRQNPAADPSCQFSQRLLIQEQSGLSVQLTRLMAGAADWTGRIGQLFGTTHLAPFGTLQAQVCWPASSASQTLNYEVDGIDQIGEPVTATVTTSFDAPASTPATFSLSPSSVTVKSAGAFPSPVSTVTLNLTGSVSAWTATVYPSSRRTAPFIVSPSSGTGPQPVTVTAFGDGLSTGVYNATLVFEAANAIPQIIAVPVVFELGASSTMSIGGVSNGASFQRAFAPGMILSVFGTGLAPSTEVASSLPLPMTIAGVSATVNGVPSPLYYVSPGQLNIQVPYETGAGPAVLGVNNNGQVTSYIFTVSSSAPGIFTGSDRALVPYSSGKPGDTLLLFVTGEGEVLPSLATGATPFSATPLGLLPQPRLPLTVTVGSAAADIVFAGIPPGLAGVTQVNFVIPKSVPAGVQAVVVTVGGVPSASANLSITP